MKKTAILLSIISATFFAACGNKPAAEEEAHHHHEEHGEFPTTTTLTEEQVTTIGIEMGPIEQKQLTASLKANGMLKVPNQNKASINTVYSGIIHSLLVEPGTKVTKGQTVAIIKNPDFVRLQEEYVSIAPQIVLAEQEHQRQQQLNAGNAGALKNLQAAEANLRSLRTRKEALEAQIRMMGINPASLSSGNLVSVISVKTPISGVISSVPVKMGTYVDLSTTIAEVVDNSYLHLDLFVYEKDLPKLKNNQLIHFTVTNNPGKEYDAQIFSLGSSFEGESKAVSVHARVKGDKSGLIDGMNVTAIISLEQATVPAVPTDAIVTYQGQDYIFIQKMSDHDHDHEHNPDSAHSHDHGHDHKHNHDNDHNHGHAHPHSEQNTGHRHDHGGNHSHTHEITFERIPVAKGTSDIGYTEITPLKKIPANAKIVTKGAFFVLATMTNSGEEGHSH